MRADEITGEMFTLKKLFEGSVTYTIDYYQREYAWTAQDVRTLITDLCDDFDDAYDSRVSRRHRHQLPPYFLGPFVYYETDGKRRFLVDGQQRFTTLHLIFIFLHRMVDGTDRQIQDMLDRAIRDFNPRAQFRIVIEEREPALNAFYSGRHYELPAGASLSVRNLVSRAMDVEQLLRERVGGTTLTGFVKWLLNDVVLVGIRAPSRDNGFRIFETMNDRGARLTSVDLLKSFLLSHVGRDEEKLNIRWRTMLGELTGVREDHDAPAKFIKAALIAKHARTGDLARDMEGIDTSPSMWLQEQCEALGLAEDGDSYFQFVDELIQLATFYRTFLHATCRRFDDLESIFFNEANGLSSQMIGILAAVRPEDGLTVAKDKARRIANYIDRWYVTRVIDDQSTQKRDLDELILRLIEPLRDCADTNDITAALSRELLADSPVFSAFETFGLRGNNRRQVRYLLARITAYVAVGVGKPNEIENYLGEERTWQVEHIFANHPERHPEITDPLVFRAYRNRLGVLGLLKDRDNNSINDMPYATKLEAYRGKNDLLAILSPAHIKNNPPLRDFIKKHGTEGLFRSFKPGELISSVADVRQSLYRVLCEHIWDPSVLQIRLPEPVPVERSVAAAATVSAVAAPVARARSMLRTDVARMVRDGILAVGARIVCTHRSRDYWAAIESDGGVRLEATGERFGKVDDAGREITQRSTCRGMQFWYVERHGNMRITLGQLRDERSDNGD